MAAKIFVKLPAVEVHSGLGSSAIYKGIRAGTFPPPIKVGPSRKSSRWDLDEIIAWQEKQIAQRDDPAPPSFRRRRRRNRADEKA